MHLMGYALKLFQQDTLWNQIKLRHVLRFVKLVKAIRYAKLVWEVIPWMEICVLQNALNF